jgi:hypothetical protein
MDSRSCALFDPSFYLWKVSRWPTERLLSFDNDLLICDVTWNYKAYRHFRSYFYERSMFTKFGKMPMKYSSQHFLGLFLLGRSWATIKSGELISMKYHNLLYLDHTLLCNNQSRDAQGGSRQHLKRALITLCRPPVTVFHS